MHAHLRQRSIRQILLFGVLFTPLSAFAQGVENPLKDINDINTLVVTVLKNGFFPGLGVAAFVSVLWGGFQWITAGGNKERVQLGKNTILWVVLGLLLAFTGYALLKFLISIFVNIGNLPKQS